MVDGFALAQAFAAGVLSFFAPCSVGMLPAYVSYYLRGPDEASSGPPGGPVPGAGPPAPSAPSPLPGPGRGPGPRWLVGLLLLLAVGLFGAALLYYEMVNQGRARIGFLPVALLLAGLGAAAGAAFAAQGRRMARPLLLGSLTAAGILLVFAVLGLPFAVLLGVLTFQQMSWVVLATAGLLVLMGIMGLMGRDVSVVLPVRAPLERGPLSFLLFGVAYGLVSMGCTLPLFVAGAVGPVARSGDAPTAVLGALSFGLGMASVMVITTLSIATSRGLTRARLQGAVPWVKPVSNVVLILAGLYIAWYDWTVLRLTA